MREIFRGIRINIKNKIGLNNFSLKKISLIFLLLVLFFTPLDNFKYLTGFTQIPAFAGELEDKQQELYNLQKQIQDLNNSLYTKQQEERTLANEIAIMDGQIKEIELQIQATQIQIDQTQAQIDELTQKIAEIEKEIERQKEVLGEHIRVLYEEGQISTLEIIASSDSFSDFVNRSEYLETMQQTIKEAIDKIKALKAELDAKKQDLVNQQNQLTELRNQQEAQRQEVDYQRSAKQVLLDRTKGEEAAFQVQLEEAEKAFAEIQSWLSSFLGQNNYVSQGIVKTGDVIGFQGNTGYSFGSHLHFGVYIGNIDVDPMTYLTSGSLVWPEANAVVTQTYWGTFSHKGRGWPGGVDMYDGVYNGDSAGAAIYGRGYGAPIMAAAAGDIIYNGTASGFGHHVIISHGNNLFTLYAHLQ